MMLVTRQYFLKMPEGTVFCKFPLNDKGDAAGMTFGIGAPRIKGESIGDIDFFDCTLGESLWPKDCQGSEDFFATLSDMQDQLAKEVPFELVGGRDGFFEDENVGFLIFSRQEVEEMIKELQEALKTGYKED